MVVCNALVRDWSIWEIREPAKKDGVLSDKGLCLMVPRAWREHLSTAAIVVIALLAGCSDVRHARELREVTGRTMGTTYSVKYIDADGRGPAEAGVKDLIDTRLHAINGLMSTYEADSEISRFNAAQPGRWFPLSVETLAVLELSHEISALSGGSFDVTVGPLVELWGFGATASSRTVPDADQLAAARAVVGHDRVTLEGGAVRTEAGLRLDFSSIAKGYAVDELASLMREQGSRDHLVEIGGEMFAAGLNGDGVPWRIAIETPEALARRPYVVMAISDAAVATSGDYRNYFEQDGRRYSHTIDPVTGMPVSHDVASVTVVEGSSARADALATALNVMGPEAGMMLAREHDLAVLFIIKTDDGFSDRYSPAMEQYFAMPLSERNASQSSKAKEVAP